MFSNGSKYFIFAVGQVEINPNWAQDRPHIYPIYLNENITKIVIKKIFSSAC